MGITLLIYFINMVTIVTDQHCDGNQHCSSKGRARTFLVKQMVQVIILHCIVLFCFVLIDSLINR